MNNKTVSVEQPEKKLGFIGLGRMGKPMAVNLALSGNPLFVLDTRDEPKEFLLEKGAMISESPSHIASNTDILFLCLPSAKDIEHVLFGPNGVVSTASQNLVIIDTSTIVFTAARDFNERLSKFGLSYNDCPISVRSS